MVSITLLGIYVDKFCHIVADPLCILETLILIIDLILGNSGFGDLVKLLNLRWALNVMVIFYIFACKATKLKFHQVTFALV